MRVKIDWASLIVGSKFTVFALFYFVFEGNFPSTSPRGAYIWRGDLTGFFLRYRFGGPIFEGLIHGGAYFRNFMVMSQKQDNIKGRMNFGQFAMTGCIPGAFKGSVKGGGVTWRQSCLKPNDPCLG